MEIKLQTQKIYSLDEKESLNDQQKLEEKHFTNNLGFAAKKLASEHDLDLYYKPRPNVNFSNHAVAVVAATAAVGQAAAALMQAHQAAKRGRMLDSLHPIDLQESQVLGLDINSLLKIREEKL